MMKWYNSREKYNDFEISNMINKKLIDLKMTDEDFYQYYKDKYEETTREIIKNILDGESYFNLLMLEIASDFLKIDYDDLVEMLEDDNQIDFRCGDTDEEDKCAFCELASMIFSEMIEANLIAKNEVY